MNHIVFKGLGLEFFINPVAIDIFGVPIHWYGIIISIGFLLGLLIAVKYGKYEKIDTDTILDLTIIAAPVAIICARAYYVIFNFSEYAPNPLEIFAIWHGGLAIYGAIIGAIATIIVYCRYKRINVWSILDITAPAFPLAQAIGRWGNFVNQEAYGRETNLPWSMTINENGMLKTVHPTFAYESLWNLVVVLVVVVFYKHKKVNGEPFLIYIGLYSLGRLFIESLRTDSLYLGSIRVSQILAAILILSSITLFFIHRSRKQLKTTK
jgi:phosphatidylglycerol:prolipoprotein diacylglycerol transferase